MQLQVTCGSHGVLGGERQAGSSGAARKVRTRRPSVARARPAAAAAVAAPAAGGARIHRDMGWVGVRERLWGGYAAEIRIPSSRKRIWIGRFQHAMQAALAYAAAMFLFYGRNLPKLRRYNFPAGPRPNFSEFVRRALTVANVKAIAEDHARRFWRFVPLPPPVIPAPPAAPAPPLQVVEAGAGVGATTTTVDGRGNDEIYIDVEILTAADCQFSGAPDEDFVKLIREMDKDLVFSEI
uniref:AP2/ERF domain-containing protein n=1 Tax=Setaria italica TaxID=4555 RepID=K3YKX4_SETIT